MRLFLFVWAVALQAQIGAPAYTAASFVNAASNAELIAPGAMVSVYGTNLSFETKAVTGADIRANRLPTRLGGAAVQVIIGGLYAPLLYISPGQINFVMPNELLPGKQTAWVVRQNVQGPMVQLRLSAAAPGLFGVDKSFLVATRPDGSAVTKEAPAQGGEWVTLWANGLGPVVPPLTTGELAPDARTLKNPEYFRLSIDGRLQEVGYAGTAPGFAGLYQINVKLPESLPENPEVRVGFDNVAEVLWSPQGALLPLRAAIP